MSQVDQTRTDNRLPRSRGWDGAGGATASQRTGDRLRRRRLFLPLFALGLIVGLMGAAAYLQWHGVGPAGLLFGAQLALPLIALAIIALTMTGIQRELLHPLALLQDWATRIRSGNLSARIPTQESGEFAELFRDINSLGESLKTLSQNLDDEVKRQTERIAQKTHSLQVLYDVAASINVSRDLKDLLTRFLHTMRDIVDARAGTVRIVTDDGKYMEMVAAIGLSDAVVENERIVPVNRCLCGNALEENEVLYQEDIRDCSQFVGRPMLEDEDMEMIAVPLQYRGSNLGVYNLFVKKQGLDAREDVKALFTSIGRHLGMAIEKARLDREARQLSIIQERTALAHELHDSLAQTLASLRFQVSMLNETLDHEGEDAAKSEIEQIKNGLDEAYTELRELLAHFRAPIDARGLLPAIEDMISRFQEQTGIHTFLQKEWDSNRLPANMEMQILRIMQEALANIRKHAQAHTVRIILRCNTQGDYHVLIEDDGVGLGRPAFSGHPGEHIGLSIMQERARYLNGDLKIESEAGEGTRVTLTFHYPDDKSDDVPGPTGTHRTIPLVQVK